MFVRSDVSVVLGVALLAEGCEVVGLVGAAVSYWDFVVGLEVVCGAAVYAGVVCSGVLSCYLPPGFLLVVLVPFALFASGLLCWFVTVDA